MHWSSQAAPARLRGFEIACHGSPAGPDSPSLWLGKIRFPLSAAELTDLAEAAAPDRRMRAAWYRQPADQARCLAAGLLARHATGLDVTSAPDGRPYFAARPGCLVSLAHSGPWVACALYHQRVGVDLEDLQAPIEPGMCELFMSARELRRHDSLPTTYERQESFFDTWTLKEAYFKATSGTLRFTPTKVTVSDQESFRCHRDTLGEKYRLALVWEEK